MKQKYLCALLPLLFTATSQAVTTLNGVTLGAIPGLSSDSTFATWNTLNLYNATTNPGGIAGTGSFPGTTLWSPVSPQAGSNESNTKLVKIANGSGGGPYAAGSSMYYGGFANPGNVNGGTLALSSDVPVDNLQTVLFQIQIGGAASFEFFNGTLPSLTYTLTGDATVYSLAASDTTNFNKFDNGTITMPTGEEQLYINSYAIWFDFSAVSGDVGSFKVSWTGVQHAQLYGISIQQDDVALSSSVLPANAVPEPSALLLGSIGALFLLRRRK